MEARARRARTQRPRGVQRRDGPEGGCRGHFAFELVEKAGCFVLGVV